MDISEIVEENDFSLVFIFMHSFFLSIVQCCIFRIVSGSEDLNVVGTEQSVSIFLLKHSWIRDLFIAFLLFVYVDELLGLNLDTRHGS